MKSSPPLVPLVRPGMGQVYKAHDKSLDRIVAIKVLPQYLADKPELCERFEREARAIASLNHPHICTLYDIGRQDGIDFLVMEYLEGETPATCLLRGPLPLEQVLQYAIEISDAPDKAQREGISAKCQPQTVVFDEPASALLSPPRLAGPPIVLTKVHESRKRCAMAMTGNVRTRVLLLRPVLMLLATIGTAGCSHKTAPGAQTAESREAARVDLRKLPGTLFQVTYSENTVAVEQTTLRKILRGVSEDHNRFLFDGSANEIKQLAPGKILFLKDIGFKKVLAVAPRGSSLVEVDTENAVLFDAISDGEIKWNYPINFESLVARQGFERLGPPMLNSAHSREWGEPGLPVVYADGPKAVELKGTFDEWEYDITATPGLNRIDVNASMKKQIDSATLAVQASGYISNFETAFDLLQRDRGAYKYFDWTNKNLNGNLSVNWEAYYEGTGPMTKEEKLEFTFPYPLEVPLPIGGIPFSIKFGGAMLFKPGFTGKGELAKGKFQVDYNGVQGIQLKGGTASADGEAHGDDKIIEAPALTTIGPEGFINGLVFPRVELRIEDDDLLDAVADSIPDPPANSGFLTRHATSALAPASSALRTSVNVAAASASGSFVKDTKSSASAYAEVVVVSSIVAGSAMGLPCEQVQLLLTGKIGAHAAFVGKSLLADPYEIELFKHGTTQKNCQ